MTDSGFFDSAVRWNRVPPVLVLSVRGGAAARRMPIARLPLEGGV